MRSAGNQAELDRARLLGPFDGRVIDLSALPELGDERFLEVEARLVSGDRRSSPKLEEIRVQVHCPL
jgi:hypothetical protein